MEAAHRDIEPRANCIRLFFPEFVFGHFGFIKVGVLHGTYQEFSAGGLDTYFRLSAVGRCGKNRVKKLAVDTRRFQQF